MRNIIYLDYAAATPVDKQVLRAMKPYWSERFYNPSSLYLASKDVKRDVESARARLAGRLGSKTGEIIFTSGGTEANNLAIKGIMDFYPKGNVVVSAVEHESVLEPARQYDCRIAPVKADGLVDLAKLEKLIDDKTVLVSVIYANNEVGTVQRLRKISKIIKDKRQERTGKKSSWPLYFHSDGAQAANYLDLHITGLGIDMLSINGGKIYGPKASGALYARAGILLNSQILGGGQEIGRRSGTENVAGVVGLAEAMDIAQSMRLEESKRLNQLQQYFLNALRDTIPKAKVNGSLRRRLPNNIHITLPDEDNERLIMSLDEKGTLCAAGSACSASKEEPSHVLKAMGISDQDARSSLRLSLGRGTTKSGLDRAINELAKLTK